MPPPASHQLCVVNRQALHCCVTDVREPGRRSAGASHAKPRAAGRALHTRPRASATTATATRRAGAEGRQGVPLTAAAALAGPLTGGGRGRGTQWWGEHVGPRQRARMGGSNRRGSHQRRGWLSDLYWSNTQRLPRAVRHAIRSRHTHTATAAAGGGWLACAVQFTQRHYPVCPTQCNTQARVDPHRSPSHGLYRTTSTRTSHPPPCRWPVTPGRPCQPRGEVGGCLNRHSNTLAAARPRARRPRAAQPAQCAHPCGSSCAWLLGGLLVRLSTGPQVEGWVGWWGGFAAAFYFLPQLPFPHPHIHTRTCIQTHTPVCLCVPPS
jgi:hypothetical protein